MFPQDNATMPSSNLTGSETIQLARALIRKPSVTPDDAGCQEILGSRLTLSGFECEQINQNNVTNLWARRGQGYPLLVFAGHTDVVPTGPLEKWIHPPFDGVVADGILHGRGAADMKGSIASFVCACERFLKEHPRHKGSIGLLITSDEEGPALDGTRIVLEELESRGIAIDMCIVGEPTSSKNIGDVIKVGRRGSLNARLLIHGTQGHIAYPQMANNPIHLAMSALNELICTQWDQGNEHFQPTSLQISNINAGTGASNVIPGEIEVLFNIRFSPETTEQFLRETIESLLGRHDLRFDIQWDLSGQSFETKQGHLINAVSESIHEIAGYYPEQSTSGGTSDGRFISPTGAQVVELGPVNATIHQLNERVSTDDLEQLAKTYQRILEKLLL